MINLLKHEIKARIMTTLLWAVALSFFGMTYIIIYPEVEEQIRALADWGIYRAMGFDMATFEGFLGSTVVLVIPLFLGIYVIIASTRCLAGEEENGTLELLLASSLKRWQIVTAKAVALSLSLFVILVVVGVIDGLVLNSIRGVVAVDITFTQFLVAIINGWPLMLLVAMIGLFLAAYLPTQRAAAITLTMIYLVNYFGENFSSHVKSLSWLAPFSIFSYFDSSAEVFQVGVQAQDVLILLGLALLFFGLAAAAFRRRNVTVSAWPWQR